MKLTETLRKFFRHFKKKMSLGLIMLFFINIINAQDRIVQGLVTDAKGIALPGVSVVLKGTSKGIVTNIDGKFSVNVPGKDAVLTFNYVGYKKSEVVVGEQTIINTTLQEDVT
jgi:TonB-dependent starch-binding outer membrane protein SusC